jgi:hypothetical protein
MNIIVFENFVFTYLVTTGVGVVGGILLIFLRIFKGSKLQYHFIYNFFGTFNIILGIFSLALVSSSMGYNSYVGTACLGVGVIIYFDIYSEKLVPPKNL